MTIDEKIKNAEALFRNYYLANGKEDIKIGDRILEENGFGKDFWAVICPVLQKKGVLKSYRYEIITLDTLELYKNYVNPRDVQHLDARINHMERELEWQYTRQGISPFLEGERVEKIRDIKKQLEELKNERNTAERVHSFKINAAYFKNETNHFPENSAAEKVRAAGDKSFNFENEKRGISAIESADEYKIVTDKWINIKHILDALYKLLSPIDTEAVQVVSLRANFLPYEQNLLFKSVIFDMFKVGVIGDPSRTMRPVVINSNLATKVLTGEYIPIKVVAFKAYRKQVSDLVVWIEGDATRFTAREPATNQANDLSHELESESSFPKLKAGTQWKHFTFRFVDDEKVMVKVGNGNNVEQEVSYADLGCDDKRKTRYPLYDVQWQLLLDLAASHGEIAPGSPFFKDGNEKAKQALTERLHNYFHVPDDPFYAVDTSNSTKKKGSYKFRADIFPAPTEAPEEESTDDELGKDIRQSHLDQTPMIDDTE